METIPHRELRNDSSRVLARVQAGERFVITNRGRPVAVLAPPAPPSTEIERLRESGRTRAAAHLATALRVEADEFISYDVELITAAARAGLTIRSPGAARPR